MVVAGTIWGSTFWILPGALNPVRSRDPQALKSSTPLMPYTPLNSLDHDCDCDCELSWVPVPAPGPPQVFCTCGVRTGRGKGRAPAYQPLRAPPPRRSTGQRGGLTYDPRHRDSMLLAFCLSSRPIWEHWRSSHYSA